MLSLAVHHNITVTREESLALHRGEEVVVTGVSVPVWRLGDQTSEPAREVFCRYVLVNPREDRPVRTIPAGYEIALPFRPATLPDLTDEEWRRMRRDDPAGLEALYEACVPEISSKNLLDPEDGGSMRLSYREHTKIKNGDDTLRVVHYVSVAREDA